MSQEEGNTSSTTMIELPDKTYFKIGEVAKLLEVEPYVLRYWETEFDVLAPEKTNSGQRVYQRDDIELLFQIRTLLYEEMFTIAGACRQLERSREGKPSFFDLEGQSTRAAGTAVAGDGELRRQLESARRELAAAQTKMSQVEERFVDAHKRLSQRTEQLDAARENVEALEDRLEELRSESSLLRQENERVTGQLAATRRDLEERGEVVDSDRVEELSQEVARLQERLEEARDDAKRRKRRREKVEQDRRRRRRHALRSLRREVETVAQIAESKN